MIGYDESIDRLNRIKELALYALDELIVNERYDNVKTTLNMILKIIDDKSKEG